MQILRAIPDDDPVNVVVPIKFQLPPRVTLRSGVGNRSSGVEITVGIAINRQSCCAIVSG